MGPLETESGMEDQEVLAYLLGTLAEEKRPIFEQRYFSDPVFFEQVEAFEEELIRDYVRGQVSASVHASVDKRIAVDPILKRKVAEASALAREFQQIGSEREQKMLPFKSRRRMAWLVPALCAAAAVLAAVAWLETRTPQRQSPVLTTHEKTAPEKIGSESANSPATGVVAVVLSPGVFRGGREKDVYLPASAELLQLTLRSNAILQALEYKIAVHSESGATRWSGTAKAQGNTGIVVVSAPAARFTPGRYLVTVSRTNPDDALDYSFVVRR